MDPDPENLAANCLSEANRNRDVQTVQVNAQVTMVIWIIEIFANLFIIIWNLIAWVMEHNPGMSNLSIPMLWLYIIIPYTFLMNTSYNKDLIMADGWKTVLLNSLPLSFFSNHSSVENEQESEENVHDATESNTNDDCNIENRPRSKEILKELAVSEEDEPRNCDKVFMISKTKFDKPKIIQNEDLEIEDLEMTSDYGKFD